MTSKQSAAKSATEGKPINAALVHFDQLPDAAEVRVPTVAALHGVSIVTAWRWSKNGNLPACRRRQPSWPAGGRRSKPHWAGADGNPAASPNMMDELRSGSWPEAIAPLPNVTHPTTRKFYGCYHATQ